VNGTSSGFLREALFNGNGVAKRLILALVLFSSLITTVITALELYGDYRRDLRTIDRNFDFIAKSYLPALVEDVWVSDSEQVQTMLDGLRQLPDIEFIGVTVDGAQRWGAGEVASTRMRTIEVPLQHEHRGQMLTIGTLRVVASVDRVLERLWDHLLVVLISNGIKTLLVAGFVLLVFQWLVTRHLATIAGFVRNLNPLVPRGEQVQLARPATGRWRPDVLDAVTGALNQMSHSLHRSQIELREREARYRAIVEMQDDAVCRWLPDTTLTFTNARYCSLFGLTDTGAQGRKWLDFVPDNERPQVAGFYAQLAQQPRVVSYEHTAIAADGTLKWIAWTDVPLFDEAGSLTEFQSVGRDITERKRAEEDIRELNRTLEQRVRDRTAELVLSTERAEKANRAKSEFLSHMSHELRTPMNAILGFAQIIELANPTDEQRRWAGEIRRAGDHLLELIDELLDLSRIEVGRLAVRIEPVSVQRVIEESVQIIEPLLRHSPLDLTIRAARVDDHAVLADRTRLRQVLVNLLSNAVKYNRARGEISLDCLPAGSQRLRISVRDTGAGIAPEQLDRLFKPFERLGAKQHAIEGTGIGLALSKQLAELMGAELGVESQLGKGSTFWIELRQASAQSVREDDAASVKPSIGEGTAVALYVEDNPANVAVMQAFVDQLYNLSLLTAVNAREGLALARQYRPQVILLDIHLPDGDGYDVLQQMKTDAATRDIPVIALTADAMPADRERGRAAGFSAYLTKPVKFGDLAKAIESALSLSA